MSDIGDLLEEMKREQFKKGRELGYMQALEDFYNALLTTHMLPSEIYNKLKIDTK